MAQPQGIIAAVLAEFFRRLQERAEIDAGCVLRLEGLVKAERLTDAAAIQAALSPGEEQDS